MKFIFLFVFVFVGILNSADSIQEQLVGLESKYGVFLGEGVTLQPEEYRELAFEDAEKYPLYAQNDDFLRLCGARIIVCSRCLFLADAAAKEGPIAKFLISSVLSRLGQLNDEINQLYSKLR